jgi:catechol 2,3-dioxygenase-like lactoylglutathione lyase family enzyme
MSSSRVVCIYLYVNDMQASIEFYKQLLQMDVERRYENRWVQFKISEDIRLGLLNPAYDEEVIAQGKDLEKHYNEAFIRNMPKNIRTGNRVILNLRADNLLEEYERVKQISPGYVSEMMYVDFMFPYNFFMMQDPDGNWIEIADA